MRQPTQTVASDSDPIDAGSPVRVSKFKRDYAIRGEYQQPDTKLTLREGLAEYYVVNPGLSDPEKMEHKPSATYFLRHDTTHVIFGTHTGPLDEGVNDLLTFFGVDISYFRYIREFAQSTEAKSIAKEYAAPVGTIGLLINTLRLLPRTWRSCRGMHKKWPWAPPSSYFDRPIAELRAEYGIVPWRPEVALSIAAHR